MARNKNSNRVSSGRPLFLVISEHWLSLTSLGPVTPAARSRIWLSSFCKFTFPMTVHWFAGCLVGWSVIISLRCRMLLFHPPYQSTISVLGISLPGLVDAKMDSWKTIFIPLSYKSENICQLKGEVIFVHTRSHDSFLIRIFSLYGPISQIFRFFFCLTFRTILLSRLLLGFASPNAQISPLF